ncbi:carboxymuconolactone decarboxylase family protein [Bradyrhizobium sp.]|uniref:carboxymuconolactone decarboxylase family protein n=1 Tax=Bradyrhizobium sp. TaxID=376 RepID=UPI00238EC8D4|nr:carboxymuconolactone decarboxylase family protein [Bradyrhizobium sp.]MDE1933536.1 carboxymuconolactone decarboxylase family protein [Bradyrhizobium sp.]
MTAQAKLNLPQLTVESAESASRTVLEKAKAQVGFIPNMYKGMANLPGFLNTYLDGYAAFRAEGGFTPAEQEVVFLVISRGNGCEYCVSAHSMLAAKISKVPENVLIALRDGAAIPDPKLAALSAFTETMRRTRGLPTQADLVVFLAAGYSERHVLAIVLALAVKTLSNYSNHLFHTQLDEVFSAFAWRKVG